MVEEQIQSQQSPKGNMIYADQLNQVANQLHSIVKMITDIPTSLPQIRRIFRGESLYQNDKGESTWVQQVKPRFVKIDFKTNQPIKIKQTMPWNDSSGKPEIKEVYVPNDEAIEEVLTMLSFMGINLVTPITTLSEDDIVDDLREFEMELSSLLTLKQKEWGIDKEIRPMIFQEIKTLIQDIRYMALKGQTLKKLTEQVQKMEQVIHQSKKGVSPYG